MLIVTIVAVLLAGIFLVIRDTSLRAGRWGINLKLIVCPRCSRPSSTMRAPRTSQQALWGGMTCDCGCKLDKWGREIA